MEVERPLSLKLREAVGREDLDRVRRLLADYASEFDAVIRESLARQGFQKELDELPGRYAAPSGALYLATIEGRPAGCVAIRELGHGDCEMKRLYVAPAFRSRGLGACLIKAAIERGSQIGYRRMVLDSTPEMPRAVALYRSFGFEEVAPPVGGDHALYFIRRPTRRE